MLVSRSGLPLTLKSIGETLGGRKRYRRGQRGRRGERDDKGETCRRKKRDKEREERDRNVEGERERGCYIQYFCTYNFVNLIHKIYLVIIKGNLCVSSHI